MLKGLFRRLTSKTSSKPDVVYVLKNCPGTYSLDVVGENHYQSSLNQICGGKTKAGHKLECEAHIVPDDNNPFDANAMAVYIGGLKVGHLSRDNAKLWRATLRKTYGHVVTVKCPAVIVGGWRRERKTHIDEGHYGVKLDIG
jgi:hypothetical protein